MTGMKLAQVMYSLASSRGVNMLRQEVRYFKARHVQALMSSHSQDPKEERAGRMPRSKRKMFRSIHEQPFKNTYFQTVRLFKIRPKL